MPNKEPSKKYNTGQKIQIFYGFSLLFFVIYAPIGFFVSLIFGMSMDDIMPVVMIGSSISAIITAAIWRPRQKRSNLH